jgi:hypothetical protein
MKNEDKDIATRKRIIAAGEAAVEELIKIAKSKVFKVEEEDLSAEKIKSAAATKKMAIFDAFEILDRVNQERSSIESIELGQLEDISSKVGLAERRSRK